MNFSSGHFWESFKEAEASVSSAPESYKDLDPRALCTDPRDVLKLIEDPLIHGNWIDLGSGFGHTVLTYAERFPERKAIGVERESSRIKVARNLARELEVQCEFQCLDLLTADIPEGDTYFLYFPQGHVLDRILSVLSRRGKFTLVAIESHGDLFPRLEKESWLELKKEIPLVSPRHYPQARIYQSTGVFQELSGLHRYSFSENYFLLHGDSGDWWGDSFGLMAMSEDYLLQYPPRTIKQNELVKIMARDELPQLLHFLVRLRRMNELEFFTHEKSFQGPLRKILNSPGFSVEFAGGERVEWKDIERVTQGNSLCYDSSSDFYFLPPAP